ncbi:hypothetical protein [Tsukamurella strandjordii]|uniref:hypothetical protein n=1 Tax=Tsukamurella strandjordii TaxID=147577 RepID=UPI0031DF3492
MTVATDELSVELGHLAQAKILNRRDYESFTFSNERGKSQLDRLQKADPTSAYWLANHVPHTDTSPRSWRYRYSVVPSNFVRAAMPAAAQSVTLHTSKLALQARSFPDYLLGDVVGMRVGSPLTVPVASGGIDMSQAGLILWVVAGSASRAEEIALPAVLADTTRLDFPEALDDAD